MASKYLQKFPIPTEFPDVLHDFAKEVLRDQPNNIYEYGAAYFKAIEDVSNKFLRFARVLNSIGKKKEKPFHPQKIKYLAKEVSRICLLDLYHNQKDLNLILMISLHSKAIKTLIKQNSCHEKFLRVLTEMEVEQLIPLNWN